MIVECTRGFGKVEHPETGEDIDVEEPFETDQETFNLLDEHYPGFEIVDSGSSDENPTPEADTDDFSCGVNGCSRDVDSPSDVCWQHSTKD